MKSGTIHTTTIAGRLKKAEAKKRADRIRLVLSDCDGVLTDGGVYYSDAGEAMKQFSLRDGMGVARLREAGIESGIISGEVSESLRRRADKLHITHLYLGVTNKFHQLNALAEHHQIPLDTIAYIGDDVNDAEVLHELRTVGLTAIPGDADSSVRSAAHYICTATGGHGAFREFADWILRLRTAQHLLGKHHDA
jgi:3-deoxy-D-manno-octulosonate 8-phosphate phosphatase (KDO 8-P phosphatase)